MKITYRDHDGTIRDEAGNDLGWVHMDQPPEVVAELAKRINSHDELVAALKHIAEDTPPYPNMIARAALAKAGVE